MNPQEMVSPSMFFGGPSSVPITNGNASFFALPLPIPRLRTSGAKQLIVEVLWVLFYQFTPEIGTGANTKYMNVTTNASPQTNIAIAATDPRTIADTLTTILAAAAPVSVEQFQHIWEVELTDDAGHGLLVATDTIYFNFIATNATTAPGGTDTGVVRIGYRFKEVSLTEYVGIVQSQQ